jgi:cyclopropane fatty-acyl-phospholipid synthase-like methyltransferase
LWALGSSPHLIIKILKSLDLTQNTRVLDLACGKGAVSCKIADELGYKVVGIDLFKPFVETAIKKSKELNLEKLCSFEIQDIKSAVSNRKNFDVAILASAESLLGKIENAIISLRRCVHQNGYIIFDGSYLLGNAKIEDPEYSVLKNYDDTIKALTSQGDEIIHEIFIPAEETKRINDEYTELIRIRAHELIIEHPEKEALLLGYVKKQETECKIIENELAGCIWCIKKG